MRPLPSFALLLLSLLFLAGCTPVPSAEPTLTATQAAPQALAAPPTLAPSATASQAATITSWVRPTRTPRYTLVPAMAGRTVVALATVRTPSPSLTPTVTPAPTNTALPTLAVSWPATTPVFVGTPIPVIPQVIGTQTFSRLAQVAQWGRGTIRGLAFTPDGSGFVVGSAYGLAIYSAGDPAAPPRWAPFETPILYESLYFSQDGHYLLLEGQTKHFVAYPNISPADLPAGTQFLRTSERNNYGTGFISSPDGTRKFTSRSAYLDDWFIEISDRKLYDSDTDLLLYEFTDPTMYAEFWDYNEPLGCDVRAFSMCGNVYDPIAYQPYRVGFSPAMDTLAVLYRPAGLGSPNSFSLLLVYRLSDGALLTTIGSRQQPVETFAYAPDGHSLLVGYTEGSIEIVDTQRFASSFTAWHFNAPLLNLEYSADGQFVILQRPGLVEARQATSGALLGRYLASAYALSPTENLLAIGQEDGTLRLEDLEHNQTLYRLQAHSDEIYALAFSPDGQYLTSSGQDCAISQWEAHNGTFLMHFDKNITDAYPEFNRASRIFIYHMEYVPGASQMIGFGSWGRVASWDTNSGATRYLIEPDPLEYYSGMTTINPHFLEFFGVDLAGGRFFINNSAYNLSTGEDLGQYQQPGNLAPNCFQAGPLTPDGQLLFTLGYTSYGQNYGGRAGQVCILDPQDLRLLQSLTVIPPEVAGALETAWVYLSPSGDQLLVSSRDGVVFVYQVIP